MRTCFDTPVTTLLRRGSLLTTLQTTKRQPDTAGAVDRGGTVTTARRMTTRAAPGCSPLTTSVTHAGAALRQITIHISTNDLHFCKPAQLLQIIIYWPSLEDDHNINQLTLYPQAATHVPITEQNFSWRSRLGTLRPLIVNNTFDPAIWETSVSTTLGWEVPVLSSPPHLNNSWLAKCGRHVMDLHYDQTATCTAHSGDTKVHDWPMMVSMFGGLLHTAGHTVRTQHRVTAGAGQLNINMEIQNYLRDQAWS